MSRSGRASKPWSTDPYSGAVITPYEGEPSAQPWRAQRLDTVVTDLLADCAGITGRPVVLAVDGRQGGGKSTLADRIAATVPGTAIVHTDDVAWWESFFGWEHLMTAGILAPLHAARTVAYRPPAWDVRGREGAIDVPIGAPLVIIEGVGASRSGLVPHLDAAVWVQSDYAEATRRGIERDGGTNEDAAFWREWAAEENPFLAADRPWERADVVVCGTPELADVVWDPVHDVLVRRSLRAAQ